MSNTQSLVSSFEVGQKPKVAPDLDTIRWALDLRFGSRPESSLIEVRIPKAKQGDLGLVTLSGFFENTAAGREQLALQSFELSKREYVKAVYVTINSIRGDAKAPTRYMKVAQKGQATADCDIDFYRELLIDVDVRDEIRHGSSSTNEEKTRAYEVADAIGEYLTGLGVEFDWIDSGNGYHILPALDLPNTSENVALISQVLLALDKKFSNATARVDIGMFNPSRISKLPGTVVRKGLQSEERPWRTAAILATAPGKKPVSRELLEQISGVVLSATPVSSQEPIVVPDGKIESAKITMENFLLETGVDYEKSHLTANGRTVYSAVCPRDHDHHPDECVFLVTGNGGFGFHCQHNTCLKILADARESAKDSSISGWSLIRQELQDKIGKVVPMVIEGFEPPATVIMMNGQDVTTATVTTQPATSAPSAVSETVDDPYETLQSNPTEDFMELLRRSKLATPSASWLAQHAEMPHEMQASADEWLVDRMIRRRGATVWAAEQGSFKSILSLFLASSLMEANKNKGEGIFLGRRVQTIFQDGDSRPVVIYYIDNDSPKSLTKKNCMRIGINADTNKGTFRIYGAYMTDPVTSLDDPRLVEAAKRERAFFIVDTLSKVFEQLKENDPVDANFIMTKMTRLAYASEGVLILHHDSKDGSHGYRGATPIVAVPDMSFALSRKKYTNVAAFKEIRFKDVENYVLECEISFGSSDNKNGSLVVSDQYKNKVISDSLLDGTKSLEKLKSDLKNSYQEAEDKQLIEKARLAIEAGVAAGKPAPSQGALAKEIGIKSSRVKERILCANLPEDPRPWRMERGARNSITFFPEEKKITFGSSAKKVNHTDQEWMPGFEDAAS